MSTNLKIAISGICLILLAIGVIMHRSTSPADQCLRYYKAQTGQQLTLESSEQREGATWITVSRAGGDTASAVCSFRANGEVDPIATDLAWLTRLMREVKTCLDGNIKRWDAGNMRFTGTPDNCGERAVAARAGLIRSFNDGELERQFGRH